MPKLIHRLPQIRLHAPSGRARIRINGKEYWLGRFGTPESLREYDQLISVYLSNGRQIPPDYSPPPPLPLPESKRESTRESVTIRATVTIAMLIDQFIKWADGYYRHPSGEPTRETENFQHATQLLLKMFGTLPVADFGPTRLITLRDRWIREGLARHTINAMTRRVRQVFKWGVARELVPVDVFTRLQTVESLQPNRGGRETSGTRGSVSPELVQETLPHLPPLIQAFVMVALHSGARVGELMKLTAGMIDMKTDPWIATPGQHKTSHKNKSRRIHLGPRAQEALSPWLLSDEPDAIIFSPLRVDDRQKKRCGKRLPGKTYGRTSLQQVLRRAIDRAGVEHWTLGMLRHSAACRFTDAYDLETTRQVLGHASVSMSRHYSKESESAAREAAKKLG